jgi:hypothetical protein
MRTLAFGGAGTKSAKGGQITSQRPSNQLNLEGLEDLPGFLLLSLCLRQIMPNFAPPKGHYPNQ